MAANETATIAKLVSEKESEILPDWVALQKSAGALQTGRISETELTSQSREFLHLLQGALAKGGNDATNPAFQPARDFLTNLSRSRAVQGFSPTETATFVFSLKQPLFG
jgi:rsbT co-antagonist protein RsbR